MGVEKTIENFLILKGNTQIANEIVKREKIEFEHLKSLFESACVSENIDCLKIFLNSKLFKNPIIISNGFNICVKHNNLLFVKFIIKNSPIEFFLKFQYLEKAYSCKSNEVGLYLFKLKEFRESTKKEKKEVYDYFQKLNLSCNIGNF